MFSYCFVGGFAYATTGTSLRRGCGHRVGSYLKKKIIEVLGWNCRILVTRSLSETSYLRAQLVLCFSLLTADGARIRDVAALKL